MILASSVTKPSRSGLAPKPTHHFREAPVTFPPAPPASSALPLLPRTSHAPLLAARPASQVDMTTGLPVTRSAIAGAAPAGPVTGFCPALAAACVLFASSKPIEPKNEDAKNFRRLDMF